ncbi:MAG: TetR/AcrR family transcriptional regulator [Anaerolineae bacterium]
MKEIPWDEEIQGREEQRRLKRQAILRTAARAFNEAGFHQTSLDDLAKRLKVSKPALYHYIASKDDILFECTRLAIEYMRDALNLAEDSGYTGMEKLRMFLRRYAELAVDDFGACLILSGDQALTEENRKKLRSSRRDLETALRAIIKQGIADGSIAPCSDKFAAFALFGAFNWVTHWYQEGGELTPGEIADELLRVFENGFKPPA